jgi:hypothetical protein
MPLTFGAATNSGTGYANPFISPIGPPVQLTCDVSDLDIETVDSYGYVKPGVAFMLSGGKLGAVAANNAVYGVVCEPTKLALTTIPPTNSSLDSETDQPIAVIVAGVVQRDIAEDNLGRAYTAAEIAGFALAGSLLRLTET